MDSGEPLHGVEVRGETPARPGQERIWIEHFNPLRNRHGEVIAVNVVCQEVTEQVRAETALLEADRRKDDFLATLATNSATRWPRCAAGSTSCSAPPPAAPLPCGPRK